MSLIRLLLFCICRVNRPITTRKFVFVAKMAGVNGAEVNFFSASLSSTRPSLPFGIGSFWHNIIQERVYQPLQSCTNRFLVGPFQRRLSRYYVQIAEFFSELKNKQSYTLLADGTRRCSEL